MSVELLPPLIHAVRSFAELACTFKESLPGLAPSDANFFFQYWLNEQHQLVKARNLTSIQKLEELAPKYKAAREQFDAHNQLRNELSEEYQAVDPAAHRRLNTKLIALCRAEFKALGPKPQPAPTHEQELHQHLPASVADFDDATLYAYNLCNQLLPGSLEYLYKSILKSVAAETDVERYSFNYRCLMINLKYAKQFVHVMVDGIQRHRAIEKHPTRRPKKKTGRQPVEKITCPTLLVRGVRKGQPCGKPCHALVGFCSSHKAKGSMGGSAAPNLQLQHQIIEVKSAPGPAPVNSKPTRSRKKPAPSPRPAEDIDDDDSQLRDEDQEAVEKYSLYRRLRIKRHPESSSKQSPSNKGSSTKRRKACGVW